MIKISKSKDDTREEWEERELSFLFMLIRRSRGILHDTTEDRIEQIATK